MKIAVFDAVSDLYGSSRICRLCVGFLRAAGHDVDVHVREEHLEARARYGQQRSFPILVMSDLRAHPVRFAAGLVRAIARFWAESGRLLADADLVYCNTFGTLPVALIARLRGRATVVHLHETPSSRLIAVAGRALLGAGATQIVCVSGAVLRAWGLEGTAKACVVHNGIPAEEAPAAADPRPYDVAFVGRLSEKKGFDVFLDALERLEGEGARLRVVIAGGALPGKPVPPRLDQTRAFRHVSVTYLGEVSEGPAVFGQARVACVPSLFADPFPTVVLEGLRAGCGVVATDSGGAREALEGSGADLVPPGDCAALVRGLKGQLARWERQDVAASSRKVFEERFTRERFQERFMALRCWGARAPAGVESRTLVPQGDE